MKASAVLVLAALALKSDRYLEDIRASIDRTGKAGYTYQVEGRFERDGEFVPGNILTSRIKQYRSVRHGEKMLVKGPEGLWRTPAERLGEKVENPDPDAPRIVRTLEGAQAPHLLLKHLLQYVTKGRRPVDREIGGVRCRRYSLAFTRDALKKSLETQMEKAIEAGLFSRPDGIRWSTARGDLLIYVDRKHGRLFRVMDRRTVKLLYGEPGLKPDVKTYRLEMTFYFGKWGQVKLDAPPEVKEKLGISTPD